MSAVKEVNHAFRLLSAFAIIAVVAGHMNDGGLRFLYKLFPEYQFHLATFIFIAGYFYSPKAEDAILPYIRKKLLRLMVPMYAWNLVYGVAIHVMKSAGLITFGEELSFDSLVVLPLWHGHQFFLTLALWFIPPLFCAEVLHVLLRRIVRTFVPSRRSELFRETVFFLACLLIGCIGTEMVIQRFNIWWPSLLACKSFIFVGFLGIGRFYRTVLEAREPASHWKYFAAILLLQVPLRLYFEKAYGFNLSLTLSWCPQPEFQLMGPILPFVIGTLGVLFWLRVCKILTPWLGQNRIADRIGAHTYAIMTHHLTGALLLKFALAAIATGLGLSLPNLDVQRIQTDGWYYPVFDSGRHLQIIYLIVGIAFPLALQQALARLRDVFARRFPQRQCH